MGGATESLPFAHLLRDLRHEAHLTQEALAERAGLTARGIQNLEGGVTRPYRDTLRRLVAALDLSGTDRAAFEAAATPAPRRRPAMPSPAPRRDALAAPSPVPLTPLIGREAEVAAIKAQLSAARLLTLTGAPGIGKTRLALRVADDAMAEHPDGVCVVALAPVRDPALVLPAIAQALGVREAGGQPLPQVLQAALRARVALLVLDNFEHVLGAAPPVADLLAACPTLRVLVTSRAALQLSCEQEFPVPPLATPDPDRLPPLDGLARYAAVRLFVERARAVAPDFTLGAGHAQAIASICRRLDGLPLAIELAATRSRVLSPAQIMARLDHRLALLTGGSRDLPARHQTLRGALDGSYDLLEARERTLLQRLSVFAGGASLEAISAVCNPAGDLGSDVLDGVQALVSASLLRRIFGDGEPRFLLLESIREYGAEHLQASGAWEIAQARHADYFVAVAEAAERRSRGVEDAAWVELLEREYDNLRAALRFLLDRGDAGRAHRLGAQLASLWAFRRRFTEGRAWLEELLALPWDAASARSRVRLLTCAGRLMGRQSDRKALRTLLEEGLALARDLGDRRVVAEFLNMLGLATRNYGDFAGGRAMFEEGLAIQREVGDPHELGTLLDRLGEDSLFQGDHVAARPLLEEGLAVRQQIGDTWGIGFSLLNLGRVARAAGDFAAARTHMEQALGVHRGLGYLGGIAKMLRDLGGLALDVGDVAMARSRLRESMAVAQEMGDQVFSAWLLSDFAGLALEQGRPDRALRLGGAASHLIELMEEPLIPMDQRVLARRVELARQALGEEQAAASWAAGQSLTLEQAIAEALHDESPMEQPPILGDGLRPLPSAEQRIVPRA